MNDKSSPANNRPNNASCTGNNTTVIGESININGDISGTEDMTINGHVEGDITLRENDITIGEKGRVNANISAVNISIEGEVKGELRGSSQVTIKPTGKVMGDIRAPRVMLNDGCQFKGSVDMDDMHSSSDNRSTKLQMAGKSSTHPIKTVKKIIK